MPSLGIFTLSCYSYHQKEKKIPKCWVVTSTRIQKKSSNEDTSYGIPLLWKDFISLPVLVNVKKKIFDRGFKPSFCYQKWKKCPYFYLNVIHFVLHSSCYHLCSYKCFYIILNRGNIFIKADIFFFFFLLYCLFDLLLNDTQWVSIFWNQDIVWPNCLIYKYGVHWH